MRKIIGAIPSSQFAPIFDDYLAKLQRSKHLASYQFQKKYLVAIDATEYYSSDAVTAILSQQLLITRPYIKTSALKPHLD